MANNNVNIANKFFAYIRHQIDLDLNPDIVTQYNNSLIFIGDEKQIYAPAMGAYVGIGMTSYNNTLNRIAQVENSVNDIGNQLAGSSVTKIYPGVDGDGTGQYMNANDYTYLNNEISIRGWADYDENTYTGTNVRHGWWQGTQYNWEVGPSDITYNSDGIPKSGISVRSMPGALVPIYNSLGEVTGYKQQKNIIYIDDTYTWSYIRHSNSYISNFAQRYVDSEIDRVYHDLLGESGPVYLPVSVENIKNDEDTLVVNPNYVAPVNPYDVDANKVPQYIYNGAPTSANLSRLDPSKQYFVKVSWTGAANQADGTYHDDAYDNDLYFKYAAATFTEVGGALSVNYSGTAIEFYKYEDDQHQIVDSAIPQLYVLSDATEYNNTYNMNIKDGIQTLKEVAYYLDVLSDGFGEVTYLTYAEYNTQTSNGTTNIATYNLIQPVAQKPKSTDIYAYAINISTENIGVQLAYNIAGNHHEIVDAHNHIENIEKGENTVRSIASTSTSDLAYITIKSPHRITGRNDDIFTASDVFETQADLPQYFDELSYHTGDAHLKLKVELTNTYVTVKQQFDNGGLPVISGTQLNAGFGKKYIGTYQYVEVDAIDKEAALAGTVQYYIFENGAFTPVPANQVKDADARANEGGNVPDYYINPYPEFFDEGAFNDALANVTWIKVNAQDLAGGVYDAVSGGEPVYGKYYEWDNNTQSYKQIMIADQPATAQQLVDDVAGNVRQVYVYKTAEVPNYVVRPIITTEKNAIATADWVSAYISQEVTKINNATSNIEDTVFEEIDKRIGNLDYNYAYSDFEEIFWNDYSQGMSPYSAQYKEEYAAYYTYFQNDDYIVSPNHILNTTWKSLQSGRTGTIKSNYPDLHRNQISSYYTYNVIQDNGKVSIENRELPADKIVADVDIWGETESRRSTPVYTQVNLADLDIESGFTLPILYRFVNTLNSNEFFVKVANSAHPTYAPVPNPQDGQTYYYYDSATGTYVEESNKIYPTSQNSPAWKQLYALNTEDYIEIDIYSAVLDENNNDTVIFKEYRPNRTGEDAHTYSVTFSGNNINLYYKSVSGGNSKQYLTVDAKHHDYSVGGDGSNTLKVTANITKVEDALPTNTGFADAWDVRSYIENMFSWVNISASISNDYIIHTEAFYTNISLEEYEAIPAANRTQLYVKDNGTFTALSGSPRVSWYYADNTIVTGAAGEVDSTTQGKPNDDTVNKPKDNDGHVVYIRHFNALNTSNPYTTSANNYYVREEEPWMNPFNLTPTHYGSGN